LVKHQRRSVGKERSRHFVVQKYSTPGGAQTAIPGGKASLAEAITAIAEGAETDPRYAQALELLNVGKTADAEPLLKAVADDRAQRADREAKSAAAAYRTVASVAAISDHKQHESITLRRHDGPTPRTLAECIGRFFTIRKTQIRR
jgi:hypothetical protein